MSERLWIKGEGQVIDSPDSISVDEYIEYIRSVESRFRDRYPTCKVVMNTEYWGYDGSNQMTMVIYLPESDIAYKMRLAAEAKKAEKLAIKNKEAKAKKDAAEMKEYLRLQKKFGGKK